MFRSENRPRGGGASDGPDRYARALAVLRAVHRVTRIIVQERDPRLLAGQVCALLVEKGELSSCGLLYHEPEGRFRFAEAGDASEWRRLRSMLAAGRLPDCVQRTLTGGTRRWVPIAQGICPECPARPDHEASGEALLFPLRSGDQVFGVLVAGLASGSSPGAEEIELLEETAGEIAFALRSLESERARDRGEAGLRASREHLAAVVDFAPVAIYSLTLDGHVRSWNRAAEEMFLWPASEILGRRLPTIPPDRAEEPDKISADVRRGVSVIGRETRRLRRDGAELTVELSSAPLRDAEGSVCGLMVMAVDVTERRRAEEAVQRTEERYRVLVESLEDVVYLTDPDGRIVFVNHAASKYGYDPEAMVGRNFRQFVAPEDLPATETAFLDAIGGHPRPVEFRILDRSGRLRPARGHSRPVYEQGRLVGVSGIAVDLTAQRLAEEELRVAQKMEAIGRLAGSIAHDFNNTLSVISSYAAFASRRAKEGSEIWEDVEEIRRATERAAGLTRQLLAFSRRQVLAPEPVDLNVVVSELERMIRRLIGDRVEVRFVRGPELGRVQADRSQLEQVIMNLVVNARDALPDGGILTVETANVELDAAQSTRRVGTIPGSYVRLVVADNGSGMDAATRARIFEPFFTTKEAGKGTGLGLATVYGIVQQSGGTIWVESEPGCGARFEILLPRLNEVEPGPAASG